MAELVIATTNSGKLKEIKSILAPLYPELHLRSLADFPLIPTIEEDGKTFLANATKKAQMMATHLSLPCLADDSGLVVDVLNGEPGVRSARYAGENASDQENITKLLKELTGISSAKRTARFVCEAVLCTPQGQTWAGRGELEGMIIDSPKGTRGFGYDPIFLIPSLGKTLAEIDHGEKNKISHRAKALQHLTSQLDDFLRKL